MAHISCLNKIRSWVPVKHFVVEILRFFNAVIFIFYFSERRSLKKENENNSTKTLTTEASPINRTRIPRIQVYIENNPDHNLEMMIFRVRLKNARKPNQPKLKLDLEKLRDPDMACTFQAKIGGKFVPPIGLRDEDMDINTMINVYNTGVIDAAIEILREKRRRKRPRVTKDILDLCGERRDLKKKGMKQKEQKHIWKQTGGFRKQ